MFLRILVLGALISTAVAPVGAQPVPAAVQSDPAIDLAMGRVKMLLLDPASAEFRDLVAYPSGVVCGQVNSKDEAGGYTGFTRFVVRSRRVAVYPNPPAGEFDLAQFVLEEVCH